VSGHRLPEHRALSITSVVRRGSSWPVVVRTDGGEFLTKLRGAAQGVLPLVAEIIVGELATVLGLPVPERAIVVLDEATPSDDKNDELLDLIGRSHGKNLGFRYLPGAVDMRADERSVVPADVAATILWLDGLVMNPDRTPQNPNILLWHGQPWLIDHGAALSFHFDLAGLTEQTPREATFDAGRHLFSGQAALLGQVDAENARRFSRETLEAAVSVVPDELLKAALPRINPAMARGVYVAVLWKRLKAPRPFVPTLRLA
jgi:hypothetical protein